MEKAKPPRRDRVDTVVQAYDEVFQEHSKLSPNFAMSTRADEVRKLLASVFDLSSAKTL